MRHWAGMPIQTVSTVSAAKTVKIDRAAGRVYGTLYGEVKFIVEGSRLGAAEWFPISREYENTADALARCREIMKQIEEAKKDDLQKETSRRDSY